MKKIVIVVAASENNVIGRNNQLLWHLPNDMKFFKNTTWGMPVIMGRKTFESVGKVLPGRMNIVITKNKDWSFENVTTANNLNDAIQKATAANYKEAFIIGGGEIYKQALSITHTIYLTRVHANFDGDTFFPILSENEWRLSQSEDFANDNKHAYDYSFQKWERR